MDAGREAEALNSPHQGAHGPDAAPALQAILRVTVKAAARAGAQLSLDVVRQMLL
jgi:hypothetical protein